MCAVYLVSKTPNPSRDVKGIREGKLQKLFCMKVIEGK